MGKRMLSFLLAAVMVFGLIPFGAMPASAAETDPLLDPVVAHVASGTTNAQSAPDGIPTVDGALTDNIWARSTPLTADSAVTGEVSAAWLKGNLYLGLAYTGANEMTLSLGEKTWTLSLAGTDVASSDGIITGKVGTGAAELVIDMVEANVNVSAYGQEVPFGLTLTDGTFTADLGNRNILFSEAPVEGVWSYSSKYQASGCTFAINDAKDTYTLTSSGERSCFWLTRTAINHANDIFIEGDLTIRSLTESDGSFVNGNVDKGKGFGLWIGDEVASKTADFMISLLYANGGKLYIKLYNGSTYQAFDTGIALTEGTPASFKFGIHWGADNTAAYYVNGKKVASVSNSYIPNVSGYGTEFFMFNLYGGGDITLSNMAFATGRGFTAPTYSTAAILAGIDTANVEENLPTVYEEGHFRFNLTWESDSDIIAENGAVFNETGAAATVNVAAVVNGTALETVALTVPATDVNSYEAAVAQTVTVDGAMNEVDWRTSANLSGGQPFDILWDGENLYFGVKAATGDTQLTVQLGGETIGTATLAEGAAAFEIKVPHDNYGVEKLKNVTLTVGESTWTGNVTLNAIARVYTLDFAGSLCSRGAEYYQGASTDFTNLTLSKTSDSLTLSNVYKEGAPNLANGRLYALQIGKGFDLAENRTDDRIIEFDFIADHLPAYSNSIHIGAVYAAYGMCATMSDSNKDGLQWGIKKADDEKLYLVLAGQTMDNDKEAGCQKPVSYIALDKVEDEQFTVRLVWTAEGTVSVYVDGVLKGTVENYIHKNCIGTSTFGFQLWGPGSAMTADGANDNVFTVSNFRISRPVEVVYASENTFDAFLAEGVVADGALQEVSWRPYQTLSGGQTFDILFDGNSLYFAVLANAGDETLTVKLGSATLATATLADGASAFEVRVPYTTKDVESLSALSLTVGESSWVGKVNLVKLARREILTAGNTINGGDAKSNATVTAGSNANTMVFDVPAVSAATSTVGNAYAYVEKLDFLENRTTDVAIEFNFDPANMPVNTNLNPIGRAYAVYSGLEVLISDGDGSAMVCGIGNSANGLYFNTAYNGGLAGTVSLGRTVADGAFEVKIIWKTNDTMELYIDGVQKGTFSGITNSDAIMAQSGYTTNNVVLLRASRYDYTDMFLGQSVKFDLTDVKVSCAVGTSYIATGSHDAFLAESITVDGSLTETSWRTINRMGAGQPFDILWDGDNLYVAVVAGEGDTDLTVKLGKQVLGTATLATGANAFEVKISHDNFAVATLEDFTLIVGDSYWKGTVNLVNLVRLEPVNTANVSSGVSAKATGSLTAGSDANEMVFDLKAGSAVTGEVGNVYTLRTGLNLLSDRTDDVAIEFTFDPADMPVNANKNVIGRSYAVYSGLEALLSDGAGNAIVFGIGNSANGLYANVVYNGGLAGTVALNRTVEDGAFEVKTLWKIDGSLELYIDGTKVLTVANATNTDEMMAKSHHTTNNAVILRASRYDYTDAFLGKGVKFTLSDVKVSSAGDANYSNVPTLDALLTQEAVTVDGNLTEVAWVNWLRTTEPAGNLAAAWSKGNLFLAVHSAEAEKLELNINGKAATLDLAAGTITGYANAVVAKNTKTGLYEIRIPLTDIGFNPTDYNQSVPFTAKLTKGTKSAILKAGYLNFSGSIAEIQSLGNYTKNSGPFTLLGNEATYIGKEAGTLHYMYKINNNIDHTGLYVFSNDLQFNKLPITDGKMISGSSANGFFYYFADEDENTRKGRTVFTSIFTEDGVNLKLRICRGAGVEGDVFDLGKTLGEKFRVTQYWYADDTLALYVDGVLLGIVKDASYATSSMGVDVITYRYYSAQATNHNVNILIGNQTKIVKKYNKVTDELTPNVVFGRADLEHVQKNLNMPTSYTSANFEALPLRWTTTDASVVEVNGTIHRHATQAKSATVSVYYGDSTTPLWSVTITVDPMNVTYNAAPGLIHTAFAHDDSITMDGSLEGETWLLNGWVLNADKQLVGYFGTQWNQQYLYVALETLEATTVSLNLGGKEITVDMAAKTISGVDGQIVVSGTVAEIKIPVSQLFDREKLDAAGETLTVKVTMDGNTYSGVLQLSNVDWWATDNLHNGLPMLPNNVKSVKEVGEDDPTGNHGAKQLENGYRFYDLYDPNGTNPRNIRTYVLFMKQPVYEGFADRTGATFIEFDFDAKALPEWEWDEGAKNSLSRAFSNYGMTFSLSDKADSAKNSNVAVFGIVNTADGLYFVGRRGSEDYVGFPLNQKVGEPFRLSLCWELDGSLVLSINGEYFATVPGMSVFDNSVGDTSFVVNMIRNSTKPTSSADDMEVYITNIAFGKVYGTENIIQNLTFETFRGENEDIADIFADLQLPAYITNGQLDHQYAITWTSSDNTVVDPGTGKVTRPAAGVKRVVLTASVNNNGVTETKEFVLFVSGLDVANGNALVCVEDVNPFGKGGYEYMSQLYYLDKTNNSIIYAFPEDETPTKINLITLTDLDEISRLNRESLRLFISDDNKTYSEIRDYKLHHDGCNWYLYDFEATARYIKVHYTHRDSDDSDFVNAPGDMIDASWNESLVAPADAAEIAVPATTVLDQAVAITLPAGITTQGLRVALNGELLFHYVTKDGTVYVRIPDKDTGSLQLWNAADIELADKENVYEVTYGTRETLPMSARWILSVKAGTKFPDGSSVSVDTLYNMSGASVTASTDGGYTWTNVGSITTDKALNTGGWGIDSKSGRMFHESHIVDSWDQSNKYNSVCTTVVHYSDDGGKTWKKAEGLGLFDRNGFYTNYILSYTDLTELYGNDGTGPNVDFVFPMGAQYNNKGAFCGLVAYTRDGGLTWDYSDSVITYGNETAFEGGVSEATILQREDGTLVYYARCQSTGVDSFTISYSLDFGVTWLTPGETSTVYTTNTQALMMTYDFGGFDGNRTTGVPMFMWGGNNVMGGGSYMRVPLNFAISTNEMDTFRQIQNIFFETFMDVYDFEADHYITNASIQQVNNHDMYVAFSRLRVKDSIYMVVNDFTDWFVRTKGAYDSFEHGTSIYEGWVPQRGLANVTKDKASEGTYGLFVDNGTIITRSVPYLQNGSVSIDLYVDANSDFTFELQPAFAIKTNKCAVISAGVEGTTMTLQDGTVLTLIEGWNTLTFDLELTEYKASVSVNGGEYKAVKINTVFDNGYQEPHALGNYVTYLTIINENSVVYVDEVLVESTLDAVLEATDADEEAANEVIDMIKAIGDVTADDAAAIHAAREAFDALTQVQKDLVDRRVRRSAATTAITGTDIDEYMINYYEVLVAAEKAVANLLPGFGINLVLNETIDMNLIPAGGVALEGNVISLTYADGSTAQYTIAAVNGSPAVRHSFNADQMSETVTIQIFDAQGTPLTKKLTISVRDYVGKLLSVTQNDTEKALMIRLLDYGALAQIYGARNTGATVEPADLANSIVTSDLRAFMNSYNMGTPESYDPNMVSTGGTFSANLTLNESVDLNVYVDPGKMHENEKIVVKLGDQVLTEGQYKQGVTADGKIAIRYSFNADRMNEELTVALADETSGDVRISLTMSVRKLAYVSMLSYSSDTVLCATFAALLDYGALAQQYGGTNTDDLANRYVTADQRRMLTEYPWPAN